MLQFLIGTWFICSTNFPMWTNGNKINPTFNYTLEKKGGKEVLFDEVKYIQKGKSKSIKGYDRQDEKDPSKFTWKGKGLLFIAKSHWQVVLKDPKGNWAVIHFSKTLFTPEGVDVICRKPKLEDAEFEQILKGMQENELLKKHISTLKDLRIYK